jgi:SAM-dependent methyltransferase
MLTLRSFLEKNFHGNHFDIISAFGVIEHVTNPVEFLADAVSLLSPGGVFISEVPSGDGFLSQYCMDTGYLPKRIMIGEQHLVLPSIAAYISLHQSHGLELLELKTNGLDLETLFYENHLKKSDLLSKAQAALDDGGLGDLVRGIWRKVK